MRARVSTTVERCWRPSATEGRALACPWLTVTEAYVISSIMLSRAGLEGGAEAVRAVVAKAAYMVLGLGDVYLGAPCAVPVDPRCAQGCGSRVQTPGRGARALQGAHGSTRGHPGRRKWGNNASMHQWNIMAL